MQERFSLTEIAAGLAGSTGDQQLARVKFRRKLHARLNVLSVDDKRKRIA